jgi:hypothetical protein
MKLAMMSGTAGAMEVASSSGHFNVVNAVM